MKSISFEASHTKHTAAIGAALAAAVQAPPLSLWLRGDLGSGKTTFSRGFIHALGHCGRVKSPTYTLLEIYELGACKVLHFDLYRVNATHELEEIGLRDELDATTICLFEWPERGRGSLPPPDLVLGFNFSNQGRRIVADSQSTAGAALLESLAHKPPRLPAK